MKKILAILVLLSASAFGQNLGHYLNFCQAGGQQVAVQGLIGSGTVPLGSTTVTSGTGVQGSYPLCIVTVYLTGTTTKASIFSDNLVSPTALANPFLANNDASFGFYAATSNVYDVTISGAGLPASFTFNAVTLPAVGSGGGGGGTLTGGGTPGTVSIWTAPTVLGDSQITDAAGTMGYGGSIFAFTSSGGTVQLNSNSAVSQALQIHGTSVSVFGAAGGTGVNGGTVGLAAGGATNAAAGAVTLMAGTATSGFGGAFQFAPGSATTLGHHGVIEVGRGVGDLAYATYLGQTTFANLSSLAANDFTSNTKGSLIYCTDCSGPQDAVNVGTVAIGGGTGSLTINDGTNWRTVSGVGSGGGGGGGSVTQVNPATGVGTFSPLFTFGFANQSTTPTLAFSLSNAAANTVFGNCTNILGAPSYCSIAVAMLPFTYAGNTTKLATIGSTFSGTGSAVCTDSSGNLVTTGCASFSFPGDGIVTSTGSAWGSSLTAPSGAIVGTTDSQTLTNKSIAGSEINSSVVGTTFGGTGQDTHTSTGVAQVSSGTWSVSTALANGTTATTQTQADASTKVATTAYVDTGLGTKAPTASPTFTGTPDATAAAQFKFPVHASFATLANGEVGYDTTSNNWHLWKNGADFILAPLAAGFVTGHCAQPASSGGSWSIADAGSACGTSTMVWPSGAGIAVYSGSSSWSASLTAPASTIVGISDSQTLTNKSIAGSEINSSVVGATYGGTGQNFSASTGVIQVSSGTFSASTALANGTTATTQSASDNSTKVSTTAYVDTGLGGKLDIANSVPTGTFDGSTLAQLKTPVHAAFATLANGEIGFDSTNKNMHMWNNGADYLIFGALASGSFTDGNCAQISKSASFLSIIDAGGACGTSSMVYPTGAGIPIVVGGTSWGTTLTATPDGSLLAVVSSAWTKVTALPNGTTATTQAGASADTKVATDAYVDAHFIAKGSTALRTAAIASATCGTVTTVSATGVATTDTLNASFNGNPTAIVGFIPSTNGELNIKAWPTLNNVNFVQCNDTASSITPGALTVNWNVTR